MIAIEKDKIYSFVDYKATQNFILKTLRLPYNVDYMTIEEFEALGFQEVIDAELKENQYLGEVYKKDGKFYRDAIDIIQPKPDELFDWEIAETEIAKVFRTKFADYRIDSYKISRNLQKKEFGVLKMYLQILVNTNVVDANDYNAVCGILLEQNINLENY